MRKVLLLLFFFQIYTIVLADYPAWTQYTSGKSATCLLEDGDFIWIGTTGGLVKMNKSSEEMVFYNNANSELPDNKINCLVIADNKLWIGTDEGLACLSDNAWTIFNTINSQIMDNNINCLFFDKDTLWIGTNWGLNQYSDGEFKDFFTLELGYQIKGTTCIVKGIDNEIWIGTRYSGLFKYNNSELTTIHPETPIQGDNNIVDVAIDSNGNKFIGLAGSGIVKFDDNKWEILKPMGADFSFIQCLWSDNKGKIWAGCGNGLFIYSGNTFVQYYTNSPDKFVQITDIITDSDNNLWLADKEDGLAMLNDFAFVNYELSNSKMKSNSINSIVAENDCLWIVPKTGYLTNLCEDKWTNYETLNNYHLCDLNHISIDHYGIKWLFDGYKELIKFDGTNIEIFDTANSLIPSSTVNCIAFGKDNSAWIGTSGGGLAKFDSLNWVIYNSNNSPLKNLYITCIAVDEDDNKWIGTFGGGLMMYDNESWLVFDKNNSDISNNFISSIKIINKRNIWIGTLDNGLINYKNDYFIVYNKSNSSIPNEKIGAIEIDNENNIWFACKGDNNGIDAGLVKYDGTNFELFTKSNSGLPNNKINSIAFDSTDNMWIATDNGLARFKYSLISNEENNFLSYLNVEIYPNPCKGLLYISLSHSKTDVIEGTLFNLFGDQKYQFLYNSIPTNKDEIRLNFDEAQITHGIYFLLLKIDGNFITKKIIIL